MVGEPSISGQGPHGGGFQSSLIAFEQQRVIRLDAGFKDPPALRDRPARPNSPAPRGVLDAEVGGQPSIQPRNSVPLETLQVIMDGVEWRFYRHDPHRFRRDGRVHAYILFL